MEQNTIAVIWDFDKTLTPGYMQEPIFSRYNVNPDDFWSEVNMLKTAYAKKNVKINPDTIYLNHMLTCTKQGVFRGLNNKMLYELGQEIVFYNGIPDIFRQLKNDVLSVEKYKTFGIHVEHYIVSTGLTAMIKGSLINSDVDGIWGCEFIEDPICSGLADNNLEASGEISQVGYIVDNTSKTKAIFEINKGANKFDYIDVNSKMEADDRRVPFKNMIYIADGPSDVPAFSILNQHGGKTFAIYPPGRVDAFDQVNLLREEGRINMFAEADYSEGTTANMWLRRAVMDIAERIYSESDTAIRSKVSNPPQHLNGKDR